MWDRIVIAILAFLIGASVMDDNSGKHAAQGLVYFSGKVYKTTEVQP